MESELTEIQASLPTSGELVFLSMLLRFPVLPSVVSSVLWSQVEGSSHFRYNRIFVDHMVRVIGFLGLSQSLNTQILFPVDIHHL